MIFLVSTDQFARLDFDDEPPRPPRRRSKDISGGVLLLIAAAVGLLSWFGPWSRIVTSVTGERVASALSGLPNQSSWAFCIRTVAVIGLVNIVLGLALMVKSYLRRYIAAVAVIGAMVGIGVEVYYLIQAGFDFSSTYYGYWSFLAFGLISLVAALKAIGTP